MRRVGDELSLTLPGDADVDAWLARAHAAGAKVVPVAPRHETLEDLFMREVATRGRRDRSPRRVDVPMIGRIWAIALNTFREAARIRVLYGILVLVVGANLFAIVLGEMAINEEARIARDVGLAGISLFGSLTAIFLGVFLLYTEVQRRTIHAIVSKPIERWEFVVGKYLGMALVLTVLVGVFALAMVRDAAVAGRRRDRARCSRRVVLSWFEVLTVAAIAIFFSSFSTPFLSGIFALAMWVIGRVTPDIEAASKVARAVDPGHDAGRARDRPRPPPVLGVGAHRRRRRRQRARRLRVVGLRRAVEPAWPRLDRRPAGAVGDAVPPPRLRMILGSAREGLAHIGTDEGSTPLAWVHAHGHGGK